MIKFLDLCSGIGGGRLGLEKAGMKCIGHSDTSQLSNITYSLLHDTSEDFFIKNIKQLSPFNIPKADLLICGFPCQSFSVIGRRKGFDDTRGQLIFYIRNILAFSQPKFFIFENVRGLISHNKGETFKTIVSELEKVNYKVYTKLLNTYDYGIPQNRIRIYFVGIRNDIHAKEHFEWPKECSHKSTIENFLLYKNEITETELMYLNRYLSNPINNGKYSVDYLRTLDNVIIDTRMNDLRLYKNKMPTLRSQRDGILYSKNNKLYMLTGLDALLLQGFPLEKIKAVENVVSNRHLLMQAGNAMSVNVIEAIGHQIIKVYEEEYDMANNWQEFEEKAKEFLETNYGAYASFDLQGGSDSTKSDILVNGDYYIEAKDCPAQCGQFVLLPDIKTRKFIYSPKNTTKINTYAQKIIDHMNCDFEGYKEAGTAGKDISFENDSQYFSKWIIQTYNKKNAKYIITNGFKIYDINDFEKIFNITCKYRIKRSGSSEPSKKSLDLIKNELKKDKYKVSKIEEIGKKLFITSTLELDNERFIIDDYEYMIAKRDDKYEIRKLSNTFNANVIFSINIKQNNLEIKKTDFIKIISK